MTPAATPTIELSRRAFSRLCLMLPLAGVACERSPRPLTTDSPVELSRFTHSNNSLGLDLYHHARRTPGNVALSPLAVANAVVMLWAGARGETAAQIKKALHAEGASDKALLAAGQVARSLGDSRRAFTVRSPSRLFLEKTQAPESAPLAQIETAFGTLVEPLDFITASEPSRQHINEWIASQTENRIRAVAPLGAITPFTRLVAAGALYFHGKWRLPFSEAQTGMGGFGATPADQKRVPMMQQVGSFRVAVKEGVGVLELPYEGRELAMMVVIPWGSHDLSTVEDKLSPSTLDRWFLALEPGKVDIALPRFEAQARSPLGEALKALGIRAAFDRRDADFSGIAGKEAHLAELFHEAYVKADESGTEAAAGTWSLFQKKDAPPEFRVDQPFLFFIREASTGLILFMGRVTDPTAPVNTQ